MSTNTLKAFQNTLIPGGLRPKVVSFRLSMGLGQRQNTLLHLETLVTMPLSLNFFLCCLPQIPVWITSANITIEELCFKRKYLEVFEIWI